MYCPFCGDSTGWDSSVEEVTRHGGDKTYDCEYCQVAMVVHAETWPAYDGTAVVVIEVFNKEGKEI